MLNRFWLTVIFAETVFLMYLPSHSARACAPAPPSGKPVVNADQTVLLIWDKDTKTQHFIRQASFKSDAKDFGFLVPSPTQPELGESGNGALEDLLRITAPERRRVGRGGGIRCGCGAAGEKTLTKGDAPPVRVLEEKLVAGLHAVVLEADSATALTDWLKEHGYSYSSEVRAWAKPYIESGWKITALRVAKNADAVENKNVAATALRMSFKTDRPLFPYREPDPTKTAAALGADKRLLRIYFVAEARYQGELSPGTPWSGRVAWAGKLPDAERESLLKQLKLADNTVPSHWYLTEFEDDWRYRVAPSDVTFSRGTTQDDVRRDPILEYVAAPIPADAMTYALAAVVFVPPLVRRGKRR